MILIAVIVLSWAGCSSCCAPTPSGVPRERTIAVSIEGGEMSPAEISVNEGDSVTLRVSSDRPMELHLHGYDVEGGRTGTEDQPPLRGGSHGTLRDRRPRIREGTRRTTGAPR